MDEFDVPVSPALREELAALLTNVRAARFLAADGAPALAAVERELSLPWEKLPLRTVLWMLERSMRRTRGSFLNDQIRKVWRQGFGLSISY